MTLNTGRSHLSSRIRQKTDRSGDLAGSRSPPPSDSRPLPRDNAGSTHESINELVFRLNHAIAQLPPTSDDSGSTSNPPDYQSLVWTVGMIVETLYYTSNHWHKSWPFPPVKCFVQIPNKSPRIQQRRYDFLNTPRVWIPISVWFYQTQSRCGVFIMWSCRVTWVVCA